MAGTSSYPTTVDNKTPLQDGIDYMEADNVNNAYVPITATQTAIGANGKGASWATDILDYLANTKGPILTKTSSSAMSLSAGVVFIKNSGQSNRLMRRNTSATTVDIGKLDSGTTVSVAYYYVYAVADTAATTFTVVISTSASSPSGLTNFELIGWFYNETAGSALDITNGYVGNVKANGRDVPNAVTKSSETQVSTASTSAVDDTQATIRLYSSGRPVRITYDTAIGFSSTNAAKVQISIDGSDQSASLRGTGSGDGSSNSTDVVSIQTVMETTLSSGTHTIQGRFYTTASTAYVNKRFLIVEEL